MNNDEKNDVFEEIDLKELMGVIFKWKWLIAALAVLAVITSGILSFFVLPPVYETKAVLMVTHSSDNQRYTRDDSLEGLAKTLAALPEMTLNTYVGQMKNDTLLEEVVKKLKLANEGYSVSSLKSMISTSIVKDTNLVELKVTNTDPALAALIANTLSEEFLKFISSKNKERMSLSVEVFQEQIAAIEKEMTGTNKSLQEFNSQPRSIAFIEEELKSKLADLTKYQSLHIQTTIELDQLLAGKVQLERNLANLKPVLITEIVEEKDGTDGAEEKQVLVKTTTEPNPAYHHILSQLDTIYQRIAEMQAKFTSVGTAINTLEQDVKALQAELTEKKIALTGIMRIADRLELNHALFSDRLAQTQIFQSIDIGESSIMVVAPAMEPTSPIKPNKKLNVAIDFVLALMVGVFLAFVLEFFDNNIKNADDVRRHLDLPVMGSIPKMSSELKSREEVS
jgi:capsular polysaccharide biosynthesis protein